MIRFKCPNCQTEYEGDDDWIGAKVACETCAARFYIPEEGHEARLAPPKNMKTEAESKSKELTPEAQCSAQQKTIEETISSSEDNFCNEEIENSSKDDSSRLKKVILTHQQNLLKKYHSLVECCTPLFQFLKTAKLENLSLNNVTVLEPLDMFLQKREQILCLEHDIWASEFILSALECKIVCSKCKSSNTSIAWSQWRGGGKDGTTVFCLKCFTWHKQPEKLFDVVKGIYETRTPLFAPLKGKVCEVWKLKEDGLSYYRDYWQKKFITLSEYDVYPNRVTDMWFCEPEKFLEAIDLLDKLSSSRTITTPDRKKEFLRQLGVEEPNIFAPLIPLWEKHSVAIIIGAVILFLLLVGFWKIIVIVLLFTVISALLSLVITVPCVLIMEEKCRINPQNKVNGKALTIIAVIAFILAFLFLCSQVFEVDGRSDGDKIRDTFRYLNK